ERAFAAIATEQIHNALANLDRAHEEEVDALKARFHKEPAAAVAGLRQSALGCRWLLGRWQRLRALLDSYGNWARPARDELIRLLGQPPKDPWKYPEVFEIELHGLLAEPSPPPRDVELLLHCVPASARAVYLKRWGDPAANRA